MVDPKRPIRILVTLMIVALVLWLTYWSAATLGIGGTAAEARRGQFGDMFGAVNALFSAFTFAALIVTIISQSDQLREQYNELEKTREAQRRTDETLSKQARSLALSSAINAVSYRLHRYDIQIETINEGHPGHVVRLRDGREGLPQEMVDVLKEERHQLTLQLDTLLQKAIEAA